MGKGKKLGPRMSLADRFWSKVERLGPDECWVWRSPLNRGGYGHFQLDGKTQSAHRVLFRVLGQDIPDGLQVDHICRNRACVNPAHLRFVTPAVNARENSISFAAINIQKEARPYGHPYSGENLIRRGNGRWCRACARAEVQRRVRRRFETGLVLHPKPRIAPDIVAEILRSDERHYIIASRLNVSRSAVRAIRIRNGWDPVLREMGR